MFILSMTPFHGTRRRDAMRTQMRSMAILLTVGLLLMASGPAAAAAPTAAPGKPAEAVRQAVTNPPTTADMVDSIDLTGKNVEVVYWHKGSEQIKEM